MIWKQRRHKLLRTGFCNTQQSWNKKSTQHFSWKTQYQTKVRI